MLPALMLMRFLLLRLGCAPRRSSPAVVDHVCRLDQRLEVHAGTVLRPLERLARHPKQFHCLVQRVDGQTSQMISSLSDCPYISNDPI